MNRIKMAPDLALQNSEFVTFVTVIVALRSV